MPFQPLGPVFLSYRFSDGRELALRLAWALRAAGVPVWHDEEDIPPGDTTVRLEEALASGLSGAVLVVTPGIAESHVIQTVELPRLRQLSENPDFIFVIANAIENPSEPGRQDLEAPDRLLGLPPGVLRPIKQYPLLAEGDYETVASRVARRRMEIYRRSGAEVLTIDLQTRSAPQAFAVQEGLVVRTIPPSFGSRAPSREAWFPWRSFLGALPALVEASGAKRLLLCGGAHLAAAFAFGAALPETSRWPLSVQDQRGNLWEPGTQSSPAPLDFDEKVAEGPRRPAAVFIDLVSTDPPGDVFGDFLKTRPDDFSGCLKLWLSPRRFLDPHEGGPTADDVARRIRQLASRCGTHQIHLFLRVSFPLAVLLGRLLNTLEITLYEIEEDASGRRYVPTVTVASGRGGTPILAVY